MGLLDLIRSEKGIAIGLLIIAATALVGLGRMSIDQWIEYTEVLAVTYVAGKTVQGSVATMASRKGGQLQAAPPVAVEPAPPAEAPAA